MSSQDIEMVRVIAREEIAKSGNGKTEPIVKTVLPSFIPRYNCSDGNCSHAHTNENFTDYPRAKCENCDQFAKSSNKKCTWCGSSDYKELDSDDLEDVVNYGQRGDTG